MSELILGFSASMDKGAIALISDSKIVKAVTIGDRGTHSRIIVSKAKSLIEESGFSLEDIDYFGTDIGPGSFTGIRLALSAVRSLGWLSKKPILKVSSLDVLALNASSLLPKLPQEFAVTLDARRGSVYFAKYNVSNGIQAISAPQLLTVDKLTDGLNDTTVIFGNSLKTYSVQWPENLQVKQDISYCPVSFANRLIEEFEKQDFHDWKSVTPLYLRKPEAEEVWEKRQSNLSKKKA